MKRIVIAGAAVIVAAIVTWLIVAKNGESWSVPFRQETPRAVSRIVDVSKDRAPSASRNGEDSASPSVASDEEENPESGEEGASPTEEEKREAEDQKLADAFDGLTDKWLKPSPRGVAMSDVDRFAKEFRAVPTTKRDDCIHRALNLIPDENVMLLAGILMDKSMDKEIVEMVYNDILNRDEDVKKPILLEIFKDKTHPCWADTAWILDVTGELSETK